MRMVLSRINTIGQTQGVQNESDGKMNYQFLETKSASVGSGFGREDQNDTVDLICFNSFKRSYTTEWMDHNASEQVKSFYVQSLLLQYHTFIIILI